MKRKSLPRKWFEKTKVGRVLAPNRQEEFLEERGSPGAIHAQSPAYLPDSGIDQVVEEQQYPKSSEEREMMIQATTLADEDVRKYLALLRRAVGSKEFDQAVEICEKVFKDNPLTRDEYDHPIYYKEMCRISLAVNDFAAAESFARKLYPLLSEKMPASRYCMHDTFPVLEIRRQVLLHGMQCLLAHQLIRRRLAGSRRMWRALLK